MHRNLKQQNDSLSLKVCEIGIHQIINNLKFTKSFPEEVRKLKNRISSIILLPSLRTASSNFPTKNFLPNTNIIAESGKVKMVSDIEMLRPRTICSHYSGVE